jgi:4-hydroxyphenylpyruvate dioxygenase
VGFYLQLIEPEPTVLEVEDNERFQRIGLGTPDVLATVSELHARGVAFVESGKVHSETKGALTQTSLGTVSFELVHDVRS